MVTQGRLDPVPVVGVDEVVGRASAREQLLAGKAEPVDDTNDFRFGGWRVPTARQH